MNSEYNLHHLLWNLPYIWKNFFGLHTYYVGYLTPEMLKTLAIIRRYDYNHELSTVLEEGDPIVAKVNSVISRYTEIGAKEFPVNNDINKVLPVLIKELLKYELDEYAIPDKEWDKFIDYLDSKSVRRS